MSLIRILFFAFGRSISAFLVALPSNALKLRQLFEAELLARFSKSNISKFSFDYQKPRRQTANNCLKNKRPKAQRLLERS